MANAIKITDVKIRLMGESSILLAVASLTLADCFVVHDIKIISTEKGLILAMPNKKGKDGKHRDVAHPTSQKVRQQIETAVFNEYYRLTTPVAAREVAATVK